MMLFFDTETTGLPGDWKAPVTQTNNWPRMVQLAWLQYDDQENLISEANYIIKPDGYDIPGDAVAIHGITTESALQNGVELSSVLAEFSSVVDESKMLIAHNMDFDEKIVGAEYVRMGLKSSIFDTRRLCTMKTTTDLCGIPGNYGYKWPTLSELHRFLFGSDFKDAHDASIDVKMCAKCFYELVKRGIYI
jgi:DNA polymerase III epsilon subunit-like protein